LKSTLTDILQGDKRIQVLWEEKVRKEYSHLDFTKAQNAIMQEFILSWCDGKPGGVWCIWAKICEGNIVIRLKALLMR
jgi:hypothetical protein